MLTGERMKYRSQNCGCPGFNKRLVNQIVKLVKQSFSGVYWEKVSRLEGEESTLYTLVCFQRLTPSSFVLPVIFIPMRWVYRMLGVNTCSRLEKGRRIQQVRVLVSPIFGVLSVPVSIVHVDSHRWLSYSSDTSPGTSVCRFGKRS